ncbi:MAG: CmcJ/NvfI family oxidoreductase [Candidatus Binataceae bacterium]
MENINHVKATLNYLVNASESPTTYTYMPPAGTPARTGRYQKHTVPIYDGRAAGELLSLDKHGVTLTSHETTVANFYDSNHVRAADYPEVERLVREVTGATRVLVFDHNVRCRLRAKQGERGVQEPVKVVHNDYTLKSGPQRVRDLLPAEADELLKRRFAFINVWRPINGPVQDTPLAVCDASSMSQQDFVTHNLIYRDRTGEVYSVVFNPKHRWFYFPKMQQNEVMLIKCYDSDPSRVRFTAHTAFEDPTAPPDASPRESIESRTIAFFAR